MTFVEIVIIAFALSADAFCTALGVGTGERFRGQSFRLPFHFGLFQALMPAIGWGLGQSFVDYLGAWDHWLAGGIVALLAGRMLWGALWGKGSVIRADPSRGLSLVSLSVATSIDALAIGVVFAVVGVFPLWPCLVIGIVAGTATLIGLRFGRSLKARFGTWIEIGGALLLALVALKLFQI